MIFVRNHCFQQHERLMCALNGFTRGLLHQIWLHAVLCVKWQMTA